MLFSIIIPVYNVKEYLNRCLMSILNQSFGDYEIILVDDGSTDGSQFLCDSFAGKYAIIHVIHQENRGLSSARNVGIDAANGKYIIFIDSDDWIAEGCLKEFSDIIIDNKPDLIVGKAKAINDLGATIDKENYSATRGYYSIQEYLYYLKKKQGYSACAPFKLYRTEFLKKNHIKFKENIIHEDELWTPIVLSKAKSVFYSDIYFYYHYMRKGSITKSCDFKESGRSLLVVTEELKKLMLDSEISGIEVIGDKMVTLYLQAICLVDDCTYTVLSPKFLWKYSCFIKTKVKVLLYCVSHELYLTIHKMYRR